MKWPAIKIDHDSTEQIVSFEIDPDTADETNLQPLIDAGTSLSVVLDRSNSAEVPRDEYGFADLYEGMRVEFEYVFVGRPNAAGLNVVVTAIRHCGERVRFSDVDQICQGDGEAFRDAARAFAKR